MNDIKITYNAEYYQPNILISMLLGLYADKNNSLSIEVTQEDALKAIETKIINAFTVNGKSLIEITKNNNKIILNVNKNDIIECKHSICDIVMKENIKCKQFIERYISDYAHKFKTDGLIDEKINIDSWDTISKKFIDSIDIEKNPNDYKIFDIKYAPVILVYYFDKKIYLSKIELKYISKDYTNIFDSNYWEIKYVLGIKSLLRIINGDKEKTITKYSIREQKILDLVEHHIELNDLYIAPEDLLDIIDDKGTKTYEKQKKYISNFISRLNKKFMANTGQKRFCGKIFNDVYKINL